jgi:signal transduction histidine kinase
LKQLVSTLQPSARHRQVALAVAVVSALIFLVAAPFAKLPLPVVEGFLPAYQSALVIFDLITAVLLLAQFRIWRSAALLLLAAGYTYSALMATAHALSFPGLFAPAGVIGGPQSTAWLYFVWHAAFPLFIVGYTLLKNGKAQFVSGPARNGTILCLLLAGASAAVSVLLAIEDALPPIMAGNRDAPAKLVVAISTWLAGLGALWLLWRRQPHTVLDLWLMVVLCVWAADTALAAVLNGARFDLGWYAGRVYGLLASAFVLAVLLLENSVLYSRLGEKQRELEQASREKSEYAAALQNALAELESANRDLRAFVGSLAHDLQQPITTIASFAQVMQRHAQSLPTANAHHLERIVSAAAWAHRMIKALLEFARLGEAPLVKQTVDLNGIVGEAKSKVSGDAERPIDWRVGSLPTVQGDPSLLLLAFVNLLSNAVKYTRTREGAVIWVESTMHPGGGHALCVRDNGVGFDMAHAARLFTPFERLHRSDEFEGTGMGLANVRRIIEKHGGTVTAGAEPGRGAAFTIVLR